MKKKRFIKIIILISMLFIGIMFVGCDNSSSNDSSKQLNIKEGQRITISEDTLACISEDYVKQLDNYSNTDNKQGMTDMQNDGEAVIIPAGTDVNVVRIMVTSDLVELDVGGQTLYTHIGLVND